MSDILFVCDGQIVGSIVNLGEEPMPDPTPRDPWRNRATNMRCDTCMFFVEKSVGGGGGGTAPPPTKTVGRCRRHAPTMTGYPVVFETDWCGDHKLDENKASF